MTTAVRKLDALIDDIVEGDAVAIQVTVPRTASKLASGVAVTKAWLTVKASYDDDDPGLLQKEITTSDVPGTGQIEEDGQTGGTDLDPVLRFDLLGTNTSALVDATRKTQGLYTDRYYDVQVFTDAGGPYTGERGTIRVYPEVTAATS